MPPQALVDAGFTAEEAQHVVPKRGGGCEVCNQTGGFDGIRVDVHLDTDAPADAVQALHDKVVSTSPVGHTLTRAVPVEVVLA